MKHNPLLQIEDLTIGFLDNEIGTPVLNHVSFTVEEGEILGIVGESGSGKTMSVLAVMGLLPKDATIIEGKILYDDREILFLSEEEKRKLKGTQMAMIFQEPMTSFNPVLTIGVQVEEMLRLHEKCSTAEYRIRTIEIMKEVGLEDAEDIYNKYPHQLSGGMRQRAMIALAMIAGPKLLIADEPTTALDVTIQKKILMLLKKINQMHNTAIILVSHDLGVISSICDRAIVMKDGIIEETGSPHELFHQPKTEYTKKLIKAAPVTWMKQVKEDLNEQSLSLTQEEGSEEQPDKFILEVKNLNVYYMENSKGIFSRRIQKQIVRNASLHIRRGETLGIVGESGCGKSTLAKAIAGLVSDMDGVVNIAMEGTQNGLKAIGRPQMVFQDPYGSLNPAKKIGWILAEPLRIHGGLSRVERTARVKEVIKQVGLSEEHLERYVSQLSGGQRQRVAIASALILNPKLIILDEPVSSLDVTVQAQILDLIKELQVKYQLSYLFISHDLNVIYQICDRICVMYQGEIIETSEKKVLFHNPQQEYSRALLEASIPDFV